MSKFFTGRPPRGQLEVVAVETPAQDDTARRDEAIDDETHGRARERAHEALLRGVLDRPRARPQPRRPAIALPRRKRHPDATAQWRLQEIDADGIRLGGLRAHRRP